MDEFLKAVGENCEIIRFNTKEEWLDLRMLGIGGSDVPSIMGHSPWKNIVDIYHSKFNRGEQLTGEAIEFGNTFESIIFQMFAYKYRNVYEVIDVKDIMFRNIFKPFYQASLDGGLIRKSDNLKGILEIKTKQDSTKGWYDEENNPSIPIYYLDQAIHYFNTTELDFVVFIPLINYRNDYNDVSMKLLAPRIIYRKDYLDYIDEVNTKCIKFWKENVEKEVIPNITMRF